MAVDIGELRGILTLQDQFSAPVEGIGKKLGDFGKSFLAVGEFAALTTATVGAVGGAILELGSRGAAVADVTEAFASLTSGAGGADTALQAMRAGVQGTISDFDLMASANKVLGSGVKLTAEDMGTLTAGAKMLADRTGGDTTKALDALTTALQTGRTKGLAEFGMSVEKGGSVLGDLKKQLDAAGPASIDFADNIDAGKAGVRNFTDALGLAIAKSPVLAAGMQSVMGSIQQAFGGNQSSMVETLSGLVGQFAIGVTYVGQVGVVAGQVLVAAWYGAQTAVGALLTVVSGVATGIVQLVASIADLGSAIPGVGDKFKGFAESAQGAADFMGRLTEGFAAETAEAAKGAIGHSAAAEQLDTMAGALINARGAMEDATTATATATETTNQFGVTQGQMAAQAAEAAAKVREYMANLQSELAISQASGLEQRLLQNQAALDAELAQNAVKDGLDAEQRAAAALLIQQHYDRKKEIIVANGDELLEYERGLDEQLALMKTTGFANEMLQIDQAEAHEVEKLEARALKNQEVHDRLLAKIKEFYEKKRQMLEEATIAEGVADDEALQKRLGNLERWAAGAGSATSGMIGTQLSAIFTLRDAWKNFEEAKTVWAQLSARAQAQCALDVAGAAVGAMRSLWPKSKGLAIASVIIDTARGAIAAYASAGNPYLGAVLAALVVAAGAMQIAKINSANPGFRFGTRDTAFQQFGRGTDVTLHGPEAVVNEAQGRTLGDRLSWQIEDALADFGRGEGSITIPIYLDGVKIAESTARNLPRALALAGVR